MKRSEFRKLIKECLCELLVEGSFDHMVEPDEGGRHPQHQHLVYYEFEPHHGSYIVTAPKTQDGDMLMSAEDVAHGFGEEALDNEFAYGPDDYLDYLEESINESHFNNVPRVDLKVYDTIGTGRFIGHAKSMPDLKVLADKAFKAGSGASLHGTINGKEIGGVFTEQDLQRFLQQVGYTINENFDKNELSREVGKYLTKKIGNKQGNWPSFEDFQSILNSRRALRILSKFPINVAAAKAAEMILANSRGSLNESVVKKILETTEYPEYPWTEVSGYIEAYAAVPDKDEMYEDGLQDAITEQISKLQDSEVQNIEVKEAGAKSGVTVFKFKVEFLYSVHPTSDIYEGVTEVAENIPHILKKPEPKIEATTDLGGWDTPKS